MRAQSKVNSSFLILLSLGLLIGITTIALLIKTYPLFFAKGLYFCKQFISNTLLKIPNSLPGAFIFVVFTTILLGTISFIIQLTKTYLLLRKISSKRISLTRRVQRIAKSLNLQGKIQLIQDYNLYSFCFGLLKPQIVITTSLAASLTDKELEAVLLHEQAHLQNRDPLKVLLGKTISSMFFFLPIFGELYRNMEATNELLADGWATKLQNDTRFLRGALRKIIAHPQPAFAAATSIAHPDHIEIRVHKLVDSETKYKLNISFMSVVTSVIFVIVSLFVLKTPVGAFYLENSSEPSYFLCSVDNSCWQECRHEYLPLTKNKPSYYNK